MTRLVAGTAFVFALVTGVYCLRLLTWGAIPFLVFLAGAFGCFVWAYGAVALVRGRMEPGLLWWAVPPVSLVILRAGATDLTFIFLMLLICLPGGLATLRDRAGCVTPAMVMEGGVS
ncbi:MAG: hypothetical protein QM692_08460 [Thermomicrobiales bacterium]